MIDIKDVEEELAELSEETEVTEEILASAMEIVAPAKVIYLPGVDKWEPANADISMMKDVKPIIDEYEIEEGSLKNHLRQMFRVNTDRPTNDEEDDYERFADYMA